MTIRLFQLQIEPDLQHHVTNLQWSECTGRYCHHCGGVYRGGHPLLLCCLRLLQIQAEVAGTGGLDPVVGSRRYLHYNIGMQTRFMEEDVKMLYDGLILLWFCRTTVHQAPPAFGTWHLHLSFWKKTVWCEVFWNDNWPSMVVMYHTIIINKYVHYVILFGPWFPNSTFPIVLISYLVTSLQYFNFQYW